MSSIFLRAENLGLEYRLRTKWTLARLDRRAATVRRARQGRVVHRGGKRFLQALQGVSFALESGDRLGLVGRNGAGKTTLLRVLYGIYPPSEGSVSFRGRIDALFNINLGFRREATGRRNIQLRGLINGWSRQEIAERMDEIIEFSDLGEFIDMPYKAYSQGMAARLAFAVATSFQPEILLMDEWIGAGDPQFQERARQRMRALTKGAGIVILASHNHQLLQKTCSKVLELEAGQVRYFGDADSYFSQES